MVNEHDSARVGPDPEARPTARTPGILPGAGMSVGRLEAFSDGVLAIVITLLILDISVPSRGNGSLAGALRVQWPEYAAYLISFMFVGIIWLNHHATINLLVRTDHRLQVLNLLLLLPVSVLPWPTAVLSEYAHDASRADERLAVIIYGLVSTLMAISFNALWRYILRHPELHKPHVTRAMLEVRNRRFNVGVVIYPLATIAGAFNTLIFLILMFGLAVLYVLPTPDVQLQHDR